MLMNNRQGLAQGLQTALIQSGWAQIFMQRRFHLHSKKQPVGLDGALLSTNATAGQQWTLDEALNAFCAGVGDGIGVQLGECDGLCLVGLDIDHCFASPEDTIPAEWARPLADAARDAGYVERSPSGTGLHHIAVGRKPAGYRNTSKKNDPRLGDGGKIEVYDAKRYFTLTGWGTGLLNANTNAVTAACEWFIPRADAVPPVTAPSVQGPILLADWEGWLARGLERKEAFRRLWNREALTGDESADDLALFNHLAYYMDRDAAAMFQAALLSPFYQNKDEPHKAKWGREDYLTITIGKALSSCISTAQEDQRNALEAEFGEPKKSETYDDIGNSRRLAWKNKDALLYVKQWGYCVWNGVKWVSDDETQAQMLAKQLTDMMLDEATAMLNAAGKAEDADAIARAKAAYKHAVHSRSESKIRAMLSLTQSELSAAADTFDADPWALNTPGGIVDLRTGTIQAHSAAARCTKSTAVTPNAMPAILWDFFLIKITGGDKDLMDYLQILAGMACIGAVYTENLIIAYGAGANGKSTFLNTLAKVLGDYAGYIKADTLMARASGQSNPDLVSVRGKRLVISAETEEGQRFSTATLKQLASTDPIKAKRLYHDPEEFIPSHTLILCTNHLPKVGSTDAGTWRRITVLPFEATIPEQDRVLDYATTLFENEGGAILSWIIEGAKKYNARGCKLLLPESVKGATAAYRAAENWVDNFIGECCDRGPGFKCVGSELYGAYRSWATSCGEYVRRARDFAEGLGNAGYKVKHTRTGNEWDGLKVRYDAFSTGFSSTASNGFS